MRELHASQRQLTNTGFAAPHSLKSFVDRFGAERIVGNADVCQARLAASGSALFPGRSR
jgi:hypothetical protein